VLDAGLPPAPLQLLEYAASLRQQHPDNDEVGVVPSAARVEQILHLVFGFADPPSGRVEPLPGGDQRPRRRGRGGRSRGFGTVTGAGREVPAVGRPALRAGLGSHARSIATR
jgi:hypothetical protein